MTDARGFFAHQVSRNRQARVIGEGGVRALSAIGICALHSTYYPDFEVTVEELESETSGSTRAVCMNCGREYVVA